MQITPVLFKREYMFFSILGTIPTVDVHDTFCNNYCPITGADPGFLKGGEVQIRSTTKKGGQTGVQFWAQC